MSSPRTAPSPTLALLAMVVGGLAHALAGSSALAVPQAPPPTGRVEPPSTDRPAAPAPEPTAIEIGADAKGDAPVDAPPIPRWPRVLLTPDAEIVLHFPQIDSWEGDRFKARMAVEVRPIGGGQTFAGAIWLTARVAADLATQDATVYDMRVAGARFPGEGRMADSVRRTVTDAIAHRAVPANLQALLSAVTDETVVRLPRSMLGRDLPRVVVRRGPAVLLQVAGPPVLAPLADTGLEHVRNANHPLFRDGAGAWHLLAGDRWMSAPALTGPWTTGRPPAGADRLPSGAFDAVRAVSAASTPTGPPPAIVFADGPAELVVLDGEPRFERIGELPLERLVNGACDLFRLDDGTMYLLVAGRWYGAPALDGPWTAVQGAQLPQAFRQIPAGLAVSGVLANVPGTRAAKEALALCQVPQLAAFDRANATIDVLYDGEPQFAPIAGTPMAYAANTTFAVIRIASAFFCCYEGGWFEATDSRGPWRLAERVPAEIAALPPSCPLYPVTFVRLFDADAKALVYGWTGGYFDSYAFDGTVVYGTSCWHGGQAGWWWSQPSTWGCGAWYNPATGRFDRAQGWGGPFGVGLDPMWHHPSAGWQGWGHQGRDPAAEWDSGVVTGGNEWLRASRAGSRGRSTGEVVIAKPAEGGAAGAVGTASGDLYVGNDENLYRRLDGAWQRFRPVGEGGVWEPLAPAPNDRNWESLVDAADGRIEGAHRAERWRRQWAPPMVVRPGPAFFPMATPLRLAPGWGTIHGRSAIVGGR